MPYTFNNASAESLGIRNFSLCFRSRAVDTLTFEHAVNPTTDEPIGPNSNQAFATGSEFFVKAPDSSTIFCGKVTAPVNFGDENSSGHRYTVEGPWAELQRITYQQLWATTNALGDTLTTSWRPDVSVYLQADGSRYNTWEQINEALAFAINQEGAGITTSTLPTTPAIYPPYQQASRLSVADLINQVLQWHPDVQVYFDYSPCPGGNPIIRFKPRSALTAESIDITAQPNSSLDIKARPDLQVPRVCLKYKQTGTYDDGQNEPVPRIQYFDDCYPATASGLAGKDGLTIPIDLQGSTATLTSQDVKTRTINETSAEWWTDHVDSLERFLETITGATHANLEVSTAGGGGTYSKDVDGNTVADLPRELTGGVILECMTGIRTGYTIAKAFVRFNPADYAATSAENQAKIREYFGSEGEVYRTFIVRVAATDAITKTYKCLDSYQAGEAPPAGIAQLLYETINAYTEHEGSATISGTDAEAPLYKMGFRLSFANTQFSDAGALVESVCLRLDNGTTEITFGPGEKIDPQDWINLLRPQLKTTAVYDGERSNAQVPAIYASGVALTPLLSVSADQPAPTISHPFKLSCADGTVSVVNGRANGILANNPGAGFPAVASQTIYLKLIWQPTTAQTTAPFEMNGATVLSAHVEAHAATPATTFPSIASATGTKTNGIQFIPIGTQTGTGSDCVVENDNISGSIGATFCPPEDYRHWPV